MTTKPFCIKVPLKNIEIDRNINKPKMLFYMLIPSCTGLLRLPQINLY